MGLTDTFLKAKSEEVPSLGMDRSIQILAQDSAKRNWFLTQEGKVPADLGLALSHLNEPHFPTRTLADQVAILNRIQAALEEMGYKDPKAAQAAIPAVTAKMFPTSAGATRDNLNSSLILALLNSSANMKAGQEQIDTLTLDPTHWSAMDLDIIAKNLAAEIGNSALSAVDLADIAEYHNIPDAGLKIFTAKLENAGITVLPPEAPVIAPITPAPDAGYVGTMTAPANVVAAHNTNFSPRMQA